MVQLLAPRTTPTRTPLTASPYFSTRGQVMGSNSCGHAYSPPSGKIRRQVVRRQPWGHSSPRLARAVMLIWKLPRSEVYKSAVRARLRLMYKRVGCVLEGATAGFCVPVMQGTIKLEQGCI
jgi:hypothetical protein